MQFAMSGSDFLSFICVYARPFRLNALRECARAIQKTNILFGVFFYQQIMFAVSFVSLNFRLTIELCALIQMSGPERTGEQVPFAVLTSTPDFVWGNFFAALRAAHCLPHAEPFPGTADSTNCANTYSAHSLTLRRHKLFTS